LGQSLVTPWEWQKGMFTVEITNKEMGRRTALEYFLDCRPPDTLWNIIYM